MKILILGLNFDPEEVGIGPYTGGLAEHLAASGHNVDVVSGVPYYPEWKRRTNFAKMRYYRSMEKGVELVQCPIYVPRFPSGIRRLLHHISFALSSVPAMLWFALRRKPDLIFAVAPSLIAAVVARVIAKAMGVRFWLHIQDLEVEAAFATGLLKDKGLLARAATRFERWSLVGPRLSTISPQMREKLIEKGAEAQDVLEFRNWANIDLVRPMAHASPFRKEWGITRTHVALYSGNLANKQGMETVIEAARILRSRTDVQFVICGNGVSRPRLEQSAADLNNVMFVDLQPVGRLSDLLGLASLHLLPQIAGAADLVLPSKLANMLASGRPVVATAESSSGLAVEVEGCGLISEPADASGLAEAIEILVDDSDLCAVFGAAARARAELRWSKPHVLMGIESALVAYVTVPPGRHS